MAIKVGSSVHMTRPQIDLVDIEKVVESSLLGRLRFSDTRTDSWNRIQRSSSRSGAAYSSGTPLEHVNNFLTPSEFPMMPHAHCFGLEGPLIEVGAC
jgi:hypothetical protein